MMRYCCFADVLAARFRRRLDEAGESTSYHEDGRLLEVADCERLRSTLFYLLVLLLAARVSAARTLPSEAQASHAGATGDNWLLFLVALLRRGLRRAGVATAAT